MLPAFFQMVIREEDRCTQRNYIVQTPSFALDRDCWAFIPTLFVRREQNLFGRSVTRCINIASRRLMQFQ